MIKAKIINPKTRKTKVICCRCDLSYSARNYKILYENEKLAFFKMGLPEKPVKIYCHGCIYKEISSYMKFLKKIRLEMELIDHSVSLIFEK